jgi:hypothetical protein
LARAPRAHGRDALARLLALALLPTDVAVLRWAATEDGIVGEAGPAGRAGDAPGHAPLLHGWPSGRMRVQAVSKVWDDLMIPSVW